MFSDPSHSTAWSVVFFNCIDMVVVTVSHHNFIWRKIPEMLAKFGSGRLVLIDSSDMGVDRVASRKFCSYSLSEKFLGNAGQNVRR